MSSRTSIASARARKDVKALRALEGPWLAAKRRLGSKAFSQLYGDVEPLEGIDASGGVPAPSSTLRLETPGTPAAVVAVPASASSSSAADTFFGRDKGPASSGSSSSSFGVAPTPDPTPAAPTPPPPGQDTSPGIVPVSIPAAGSPPAAGEYYADTGAVWAGGDVTRRACEIRQKGAKGACKRYGYAWGQAVAAGPTTPAAQTPYVSLDDTRGAGYSGSASAGPGLWNDVSSDVTPAADYVWGDASSAPAKAAGSSAFPWIGAAAAAAALLLLGAKRARHRRKAAR